jgi:SAM-dependent methyltransferase
MGITKNCVKFLMYAKRNQVNYEHTIMLGRQTLFANAEDINRLLKYFNINPSVSRNDYGHFSETLFHALGAADVDSLDYSDFENATIIADLSSPLPDYLKERYTVVFDGGTLEHVFNFPIAIKNSMDILKIGGHFISITPANNQCGHGFYQFSPELFYSTFAPKHGFKIKTLAVAIELPDIGVADWYAVKDPSVVKRRITITNSHPTYLLVIAEKIRSTEGLILMPMQSDYQNIWDVHHSIKNDIPIQSENILVHTYRKYVPEPIKKIIRSFRGQSEEKFSLVEGLGTVNPTFFEKINV